MANVYVARLTTNSPTNSFTYPLILKVIKNGGETNTRIKASIQDNKSIQAKKAK